MEKNGWATAGHDDAGWSGVKLADYSLDNLLASLVDNKQRLLNFSAIFSFLLWGIVFSSIVLFVAKDWNADLRNYTNILYIKDHSENIGIYWYLFVELFGQHVKFYQNLYLLFLGILAGQIVLNMSQYTRVLAVCNPKNKDHSQRILCWTLMLSL